MSLDSQPLISIIIPTFNRAHLVCETLDSIIDQTHTNWECIIVDDGSTDNTENLVRSYIKNNNKFKFYHRPNSLLKGANACRNYGLSMSLGALINWVDSDDKLVPNHLEMHVSEHLSNPIEASVSKAGVFRGSSSNILRDWSHITPKIDVITEMLHNKVLWQTGCVIWSKSVLPVAPFNESLSSSQEWTFHLKTLIKGLVYVLMDNITYLAREHNERIGKDVSVAKLNSTALSRFIILKDLYQTKILDAERELILLQTISTTIMDALELRYYSVAFDILKELSLHFLKSHHKLKIMQLLFLAPTIFIITGKGYRFFKL